MLDVIVAKYSSFWPRSSASFLIPIRCFSKFPIYVHADRFHLHELGLKGGTYRECQRMETKWHA